MEIKASELKIDNWVYVKNTRHNESYVKIESINNSEINIDFRPYSLEELNPIELTEDILLKCGFDKMPGFTVMGSLNFNLGRDRSLSIGSVGTPNEMLFIREGKGSIKDDLVVLHNFDYDGKLFLHKLQNICSLLGKELKIDL